MKRILTTLALAAISTSAMAQYNTRVQLQAGNFGAPNALYDKYIARMPLNNLGASVQHSIYKNIGVKINYQRWIDLSGIGSYSSTELRGKLGYAVDYGLMNPVSFRINYNMIDAAPTYTLHAGKHHDFFGSIGPSVAWGLIGDYELDYSTFTGIDGCGYAVPVKKRSIEMGAVAEAGYNYRLGRISTGLSGAYRFYGKEFTTINLQLNIGYNFNSFK